MNKLFINSINIIACSVFLLQCACPTRSDNDNLFAIYLLKDSSIKINEILDTPLSDLELEDKPWIFSDDIEFYDFSTHCIYLKKGKQTFFKDSIEFVFPYSLWDKPFIVCANDERIYKGIFRAGPSSAPWWRVPYIDDGPQFSSFPSDVLYIDWIFAFDVLEDKRYDNRIKDALIDAELFHSGIEVSLISVDVVENSDTSTIKYKFALKNNDSETLYVIDPDKTGSALFHWWTNGVLLLNTETGQSYDSAYKQYTSLSPIYHWEPEWFSKINNGESIEREIKLKGYGKIPSGNYLCQFMYSGPTKIEKDDRYLSDGRYWLGEVNSNTIEITVL